MDSTKELSGKDDSANAKMQRSHSDEGDKLIGLKFPVLDHGFVMLVDYMGNDGAIVQAARVSYGEGTKTVNEDKGLIRYLMRHQHTTPFEMVEFKFLARMPMFVARQWIRHRTANVNEYSARYSIVPDEFYVPSKDIVKPQSSTNKQGRDMTSALPEEQVEKFLASVEEISKSAYEAYTSAINSGVARELARILLPVNYYTEWYWKIDLHNLFHFLALRLDPHAQYEIRQYAVAMADITKKVVPIAYEAFEDFVLDSASFSKKELDALRSMPRGEGFDEACKSAGISLFNSKGERRKTGEGEEFHSKIKEHLLRL